jgi:hypothetical protein
MPQASDDEALSVAGTLGPGAAPLVGSQRGPARLGGAVWLKFFPIFPSNPKR